MSMVTINCNECGKPKKVRRADIKRGWGKFCSKSCKAKDQTRRTGRGRPRRTHAIPDADHPYGMDYLSECGDR